MLGTKSFLYLKNEGISRARLLTVLRHLGGEDCCSAIGARLELRRLRSTLPEQEALEPYTRDFLDELFRAQLEALSSVFLAYDMEKTWLPFYSHPFCDQNVMTGADLALISGCFSLPALALALVRRRFRRPFFCWICFPAQTKKSLSRSGTAYICLLPGRS